MNTISDYEYLRKQLMETLEAWGQDIHNEDVGSFHYILNERLQNTDSFKLYRYTPASIYSIRNLEKQIIHLTENGKFNDIYEGLPATDLQYLNQNNPEILNDAAGITCFSETKDNLLMWSHYADSHRGFCVEYDLSLLEPQDDILKHIFPIVYQKERKFKADIKDIVEGLRDLKQAIEQDAVYDEELLWCLLVLFVTKGNMWAYEREWRVIYTKLDMYKKYNYARNIPFKCVSGIYLGHRIDPLIKEMVLESADRLRKKTGRSIPVYTSVLSDKEYKLEFVKNT